MVRGGGGGGITWLHRPPAAARPRPHPPGRRSHLKTTRPSKLSQLDLSHGQTKQASGDQISGRHDKGGLRLTSAGAAVVELVPDLAVALGGGLQVLARELARLLAQLLGHRRRRLWSPVDDGKRRRGFRVWVWISFSTPGSGPC